MSALTRAMLVAAFLMVAGCATTRGMMSGTRMNLKDYAAHNIGVFPVAVNPNYDAGHLPLERIQKVVVDELNRNTPLTAHAVSLPADMPPIFPLTPGRLASRGAQLSLDAAVGISIIAWNPPIPGHRARVNVIISFADTKDLRRKWTLSGTWKAHSLEDTADAMQKGLGPLFVDLAAWLKSGVLPVFAEQGSPDDPILTFFSPSLPTPESEHSVLEKSLGLVVSAMDDNGISEMGVRNNALNFYWKPPTELMKPPPVYLSAPLDIPLAFGSNKIIVEATSATGRHIQRKISLRSTSPRGLTIFGVGVKRYTSMAAAIGADDAIRRLADSGEAPNVSPPVTLINDVATGERVFDAIRTMKGQLGVGDQLLVVLAGRGGSSQQSPFMMLRESPIVTKSLTSFDPDSSAHWLRLEDLLSLGVGRPTLLVLDLCTDETFVDYTRANIRRALGGIMRTSVTSALQILADLSDCRTGVGRLTKRVSEWLDHTEGHPNKRTVEALVAHLGVSSHSEYIVWSGDRAPSPQYGLADSRFWAVASSTTDQDAAINAAQHLKDRGIQSSVVLGTNGIFNITLGQFDTFESAIDTIKAAQGQGLAAQEAFVLETEKIKATVYQ